ncbi:hypothetical protein [Pseudomonas brassicae]|uniref:hypothetical protein n=1 Tax=Pseudomonas brassicae TaxID=2708063 RepID=UPI003B75BFDC
MHLITHAPAFIHDIAPSGAAKRFLLTHIGREKPEGMSDDMFLLARSTPAPMGFTREEVVTLRSDARALMGLPDLLGEGGLPASVMNHPAIALKNLEQRMKEWTLI